MVENTPTPTPAAELSDAAIAQAFREFRDHAMYGPNDHRVLVNIENIARDLPASAPKADGGYDRAFIAEILRELFYDDGYGMKANSQFTVESIKEQMDALIAADERDAAGVHTATRELPAASLGEAVQVETVGFIRQDAAGDRYIDWTIEGGIHELNLGDELVFTSAKVTDDEGHGELYTAPKPEAGAVGDGEAVAWVVFDSKQDRYVIFNPELASAIAGRGLLTLPVFGQYEWFDAVIQQWKPINRLPYTWERELGIGWRAAALARSEGVA